MEAFFTPTGVLVVGVTTEKEFFTASVAGTPFTDANWHSILVILFFFPSSFSFSFFLLSSPLLLFFASGLLIFLFLFLFLLLLSLPSSLLFYFFSRRQCLFHLAPRQISHVVGRRPFGATSIQVHVDGVLRLNAPLKFPVKQGDTLSSCALGERRDSK